VTHNFPQAYINSINQLLTNEAQLFWDAMEVGTPCGGLRINTGKTSLADLGQVLPPGTPALPWCKDGFPLEETRDLGTHPYHKAGLYYLQEPSAMMPVAVLDPQPGERVLDLCAAPGGKTTQILSRMGNRGLLIANDPNPRRVQSLSRNLERWGGRSTAVLCETPSRISEHLGDFFDRVLVDAPCSGEGRFRSDSKEIKKWSPKFIERCCQTQDEILWFAAKMVRPGGVLVYSTCTFNQEENEGTIARFLEKNPDYNLEPIVPVAGYSQGIQLASAPKIDFSGTVRIWPHQTLGEGHFTARLRRNQAAPSPSRQFSAAKNQLKSDYHAIYSQFFDKTLRSTPGTGAISPGSRGLTNYGNRIYWIVDEMPSLEGLNVIHWGWWLGSIPGDKYLPSPALAYGLTPEDAQTVLEFSVEDPGLANYLRGSPLSSADLENLPQGWALVTCSGFSLGWGLIRRGRLKSYLPRWLRSN